MSAPADDVLAYPYRRVLLLMRDAGASNRAIAKSIGVSEATIRRNLASLDAARGIVWEPDQRKVRRRASNDAPQQPHCPSCTCRVPLLDGAA